MADKDDLVHMMKNRVFENLISLFATILYIYFVNKTLSTRKQKQMLPLSNMTLL